MIILKPIARKAILSAILIAGACLPAFAHADTSAPFGALQAAATQAVQARSCGWLKGVTADALDLALEIDMEQQAMGKDSDAWLAMQDAVHDAKQAAKNKNCQDTEARKAAVGTAGSQAMSLMIRADVAASMTEPHLVRLIDVRPKVAETIHKGLADYRVQLQGAGAENAKAFDQYYQQLGAQTALALQIVCNDRVNVRSATPRACKPVPEGDKPAIGYARKIVSATERFVLAYEIELEAVADAKIVASPFELNKLSCQVVASVLVSHYQQEITLTFTQMFGMAADSPEAKAANDKINALKVAEANYAGLLAALGGAPAADEARDASARKRGLATLQANASKCQALAYGG